MAILVTIGWFVAGISASVNEKEGKRETERERNWLDGIQWDREGDRTRVPLSRDPPLLVSPPTSPSNHEVSNMKAHLWLEEVTGRCPLCY